LRTYTCLITDDRYAVPSLAFQGAPDDGAMRSLALKELRGNPHYHSFEARLDDRRVFVLRRRDVDG
jgi:hypothetical protein